METRISDKLVKGRQVSEWCTSVVYIQSILGLAQIVKTGSNSTIPLPSDVYFGMPIITGTLVHEDAYIDRRNFNHHFDQLQDCRKSIINTKKTKEYNKKDSSSIRPKAKSRKRKLTQNNNADHGHSDDEYLDNNESSDGESESNEEVKYFKDLI